MRYSPKSGPLDHSAVTKTLVRLERVTITVLLARLVALTPIIHIAPLRALHTVGSVCHYYFPEIVEVGDTSALFDQLLHHNLGIWEISDLVN